MLSKMSEKGVNDKLVAEYIASSIAFIINKCVNCKTFPDQMKVARICPISKLEMPALKVEQYLYYQFYPKYLKE